MALAGALQVNIMLEVDLVSTCAFSGEEVVLNECLVGRGLGPGRVYSGFQVTGMIEWREKSKPKKNPWTKI